MFGCRCDGVVRVGGEAGGRGAVMVDLVDAVYSTTRTIATCEARCPEDHLSA
jgi:hypothetical protein